MTTSCLPACRSAHAPCLHNSKDRGVASAICGITVYAARYTSKQGSSRQHCFLKPFASNHWRSTGAGIGCGSCQESGFIRPPEEENFLMIPTGGLSRPLEGCLRVRRKPTTQALDRPLNWPSGKDFCPLLVFDGGAAAGSEATRTMYPRVDARRLRMLIRSGGCYDLILLPGSGRAHVVMIDDVDNRRIKKLKQSSSRIGVWSRLVWSGGDLLWPNPFCRHFNLSVRFLTRPALLLYGVCDMYLGWSKLLSPCPVSELRRKIPPSVARKTLPSLQRHGRMDAWTRHIGIISISTEV